jgi:tetratricopeptide (TPR) repeat protein
MNLEQIVKETVAKIVAEKELTAAEEKKREEIVKAMKKDFKGPAPAMYAIATDKAKKLAEDGFFNSTDLNHQKAAIEISNFLLKNIPQYMSAQDAGKLLQYMGSELGKDNNWQQALSYYSKVVNEGDPNKDHEVSMAQSSLNSILRSAIELKAKIGDQEINIPAWIQDHITNSENFIDQASQGYHEYSNGGEHGEMDEANLGHNEISSIEQEGRFWIVKYGTEEKSFESEDEARKFYNGLDEAFVPKSSFDDYSIGNNVTVAGKKAKITAMEMDDETGERRARVRFEDGSVEKVNINSLDESKELDEWTIRRMQHYAGIK